MPIHKLYTNFNTVEKIVNINTIFFSFYLYDSFLKYKIYFMYEMRYEMIHGCGQDFCLTKKLWKGTCQATPPHIPRLNKEKTHSRSHSARPLCHRITLALIVIWEAIRSCM